MVKLPPDLDFDVDEARYGKSFDVTNPDHLTEGIINGHIVCQMGFYHKENCRGQTMYNLFQEDFEGFTLDIFKMAHKNALRRLRDFLIAHEVWVKPARGIAYAKALFDCLTLPAPSEWTDEMVKEGEDITAKIKTYFPERNIQTQLPLATNFPIPPKGDAATTNSKLITDLMKVYNDDNKKYSGDEYDILDIKLQVFYDCCNNVGLPESEYSRAFSTMLKGRASYFYYSQIAGRNYDFNTMVTRTRGHFETKENQQKYLSEWRETTLQKTISENPVKSKLECFEIMIDKLQKVQRGLSREYQFENNLRDQIINACRGVQECSMALYSPADTFEGVCAQVRSAIGIALQLREEKSVFTTHSHPDDDNGDDYEYSQHWTDRTYGGRGRGRGQGYGGSYQERGGSYRGGGEPYRGGRGHHRGNQRFQGNQRGGGFQQKKCYICNKPRCWSTKHSVDERKQAYDRFHQQTSYTSDELPTLEYYSSFLARYEGAEGIDGNLDVPTDQFTSMNIEDAPYDPCEGYMTEIGEVNGAQIVSILNDHSTYHLFTRDTQFKLPESSRLVEVETATFTFEDRYSSAEFQGIMPDTGAAGISSAGEPQVQALRKRDPSIQIDTSTAGVNSIRFGKGTAIVKGVVQVPTPLGTITFHVVPANTPFLLCLKDMDNIGVFFDNTRNVLIQGNKKVPVVRKWGHPWMLLDQLEESLAWSYLTETELHQLHRRFGHPSVQRLTNILQRAGHEVDTEILKKLTKFCHQCQMHEKSPGRFKFTLKDDCEFNYSVVIDVLYIDRKPVLQVVDEGTAFQAARFLKDMSARTAWDTLRACWIDTYLGPPDRVVHDAGKNFASVEFKQLARSMAIEIREVPVESHNSVGLVERYHTPLRRAYEIIQEELKDEHIDKEFMLQMAVKAINDSAGPKGIVPTLVVLGAYPRLTDMDPPSPSVTKRAKAIQAATKEVRRLYAERQVKDALRMRNGPNTTPTLDLPLQSDVRVWREKEGWTGPYKLLATQGETCTIDMPRGPVNFRSTVVKPYFIEEPESRVMSDGANNSSESTSEGEQEQPQPVRQGPGRPRGSKNVRVLRNQKTRRSRRQTRPSTRQLDQFILAIEENKVSLAFLSRKELSDMELSLKLRKEGVITTLGGPFESSQQQEIDGLIARGVFEFVQYDPSQHSGVRIFNSRLVNEIKGKTTATPFEKSRLVIQAYNDEGKDMILTQSPTIQRASQRLIIALAPSLAKLGVKVFLRDITQAYVQSTTMLNRLILANLPKEMQHQYPKGTIMVVRKPLYGIPEAGTHW